MQVRLHGERFVLQSDLTGLSSVQAEKTMDASNVYIKTKLGELGVTNFDVQRSGQNQIIVRVSVNTTIAVLSVLRTPLKSTFFEFGEPAESGEAALWQDSSGRWKPAFDNIKGALLELNSKYFVGTTTVTRNLSGASRLDFEWDATGKILER